MLTRYGYSTLITILILSIIVITLSLFIDNNIVKYLIIFTTLLFLGLVINFFRDPDRETPKVKNVVVSPADGKVILIKKLTGHKYISGNAKQISIFMSPLNVHVNRIPVTGKVENIQYYKGKFLRAFKDKAAEENERAEFGILSQHGKVFFTQVAGAVARRIIYEIKEKEDVVMGERFGMIKFGSRVDVIVSEDWNEKVRKGDKVTAGKTILFEHAG
jgi:phosphatidylserine decarboxylase